MINIKNWAEVLVVSGVGVLLVAGCSDQKKLPSSSNEDPEVISKDSLVHVVSYGIGSAKRSESMAGYEAIYLVGGAIRKGSDGYGIRATYKSSPPHVERTTSQVFNGYYMTVSSYRKETFQKINPILFTEKQEIRCLKLNFVYPEEIIPGNLESLGNYQRYIRKKWTSALYEEMVKQGATPQGVLQMIHFSYLRMDQELGGKNIKMTLYYSF